MNPIDKTKSFAADKKTSSTYAGICACLVLLSILVRITLPITLGSILLGIGIFIFTGKKWVRLVIIPICLAFNLATSYLFGFPVKYLMPLEGYVKDIATGEPIENAIFDVEYSEYRPTVTVTVVGRDIGHAYAVSGKDGKYLVEGRLLLDFIHPNARRHLKLRHPLYETADIFLNRADLTVVDNVCREKERAASIFRLDTCMITIRSRHGVISHNFLLMNLGIKYQNDRRAGGRDISWVLDEMVQYATQAKDLNVDVDWGQIFERWDKMLAPFGGDKSTTKTEILGITKR